VDSPGGRGPKIDLAISVGIVLLVAVAYVQANRFDFTNYDDPVYVPDNVQLRAGFSWMGVGWAWTTFKMGNWHPLTWLSLMLDCQLFGVRAGGHHLVNVALHAANAVLLFLVLRNMTAARWRSSLVAALFALHPLHVESVAWIAERKDVLCTLFFLFALVAYSRYAASPGIGRGMAVSLGMALGLMCKPMLVTLPFLLLLLDYWPLKRFSQPNFTASRATRLILEKFPLLVLSLAASAVTLAAQKSEGAMRIVNDQTGLPLRAANAAITYARYLVLTFWPANLAAYYPYDFHPTAGQIAAAALLLLTCTVGGLAFARRAPYLPVGWFWFLGMLVPTIGLVQVGSQAMADRYTYIPLIGIFIAVVWAAGDLLAAGQEAFPLARPLMAAGGGTIVLACLLATYWQLQVWADSETLFRHALNVAGDNPVACENLGAALLNQHRFAEAEAEFRKVLKADAKHYAQTPGELARALAGQNREKEAIACLWEAIRLNPDNVDAMRRLAVMKQYAAAIESLKEVIRLQPDEPNPLQTLAWIYATCPERSFRNGQKAVELARRACELTARKDAVCLTTLADAYREANEPLRAVDELRAAAQLTPGDAAAYDRLADVLRQLGRFDEATSCVTQARQIRLRSGMP